MQFAISNFVSDEEHERAPSHTRVELVRRAKKEAGHHARHREKRSAGRERRKLTKYKNHHTDHRP